MSVLLIFVCSIALILSIAFAYLAQKFKVFALCLGIFVLMLTSFVTGHVLGYLDEEYYYRVDAKLIRSISYIQTYYDINNQLPKQTMFNSWQKRYKPDWDIT